MSFAYGTMIASLSGFKPIESYGQYDRALGGSIAAGRPGWMPKEVTLSDGLPPGHPDFHMIFVRYGKDGTLGVTEEQLFLLADGTLKPARHLAPNDRLAGADGGAVALAGSRAAHGGSASTPSPSSPGPGTPIRTAICSMRRASSWETIC